MSQWYGFPLSCGYSHSQTRKRWGLTKGKNVEMTERDLKKIWPKELWNKLHLQIIFLVENFAQRETII